METLPARNEPLPRGVTIIIPAYNEEEGIVGTLDGLYATMEGAGWEFEVIVVDDGSKDATPDLVEADGRARLVRHSANRGVGAARNTGLALARYDRIAMTDADGTYPSEPLPDLLELSEETPMVIGARVRPGAAIPLVRRPAKWFIRRIAEYLAGEKIPDLNSGLRVFRTLPARAVRHLLPTTHSWVSTITLAFLSSGLEVAYVPVDYHPRLGRSTFHPVRDTYNYLTLVIRTIVYFNPLKFFLPVAFLMGLVGSVKLLFDWWVYDDIRESEVILLVSCVTVGMFGFLADLISAQNRMGGPGSLVRR
jgi:glycosyltransferase involved in cell wall biosynthesis